MSLTEWGGAEQSAQLDRGRPFGFAQYNVFRGGPGSLSLSFGCDTRLSPVTVMLY